MKSWAPDQQYAFFNWGIDRRSKGKQSAFKVLLNTGLKDRIDVVKKSGQSGKEQIELFNRELYQILDGLSTLGSLPPSGLSSLLKKWDVDCVVGKVRLEARPVEVLKQYRKGGGKLSDAVEVIVALSDEQGKTGKDESQAGSSGSEKGKSM